MPTLCVVSLDQTDHLNDFFIIDLIAGSCKQLKQIKVGAEFDQYLMWKLSGGT